MPFTLVLNVKEQCEEFLSDLKSDLHTNNIKWIYKKSRYAHNGVGIELIDRDNLEQKINKYDAIKCDNPKGEYLAQKYISNPFLINGKKFDFRAYLFIASMDPLMILYHDGFIRLSITKYSENIGDRAAYLTNTHVTEDFLNFQNLTLEEYNDQMQEQGWDFDHFEKFMIVGGHIDNN